MYPESSCEAVFSSSRVAMKLTDSMKSLRPSVTELILDKLKRNPDSKSSPENTPMPHFSIS